jgi:hypothetical protein
MNKRIPGQIQEAVVSFDPDRDCWTCSIYCKVSYFRQTFGDLYLDQKQANCFAEEVLSLFKIDEVKGDTIASRLLRLEGRSFIGLYCLGDPNEPMEGMEVNDRRFTITGFRRKHWPERATSAFQAQFALLERSIQHYERRLHEEREQLKTLKDRWTEWETDP